MTSGQAFPAIPDLACSLRGLAKSADVQASSARGLLDWVRGQEFRAVALDATHPEIRARSLDRSARRDFAAALKRAQLVLVGVDVFVPAVHLGDPEHAERAVSAVLGAIELAHDLKALGAGVDPVVCLDLPDNPAGGVLDAISSAAEKHGITAASLRASAPGIGRSIDLDALADAGVDPAEEMAKHDIVQARWGGPRVDRAVELTPIAASLAMGNASCVLDLSHGRDTAQTAASALDAWSKISVFGKVD